MRIGIDCRSLQEPRPSGVSVYTRELVRAMVALPEAEHYDFVLFMNGSGLIDDSRVKELKREITGSNVEWRIQNRPNKFVTAGELLFGRPQLEWMFGHVDVVFVPNIGFFPIADTSVPLVLTVHDLSFERFPEFFSPKGRMWHKLLRPRAFVERADNIISVSQHTKAELIDVYGVDIEKVTTVYPGMIAPGGILGAGVGLFQRQAAPTSQRVDRSADQSQRASGDSVNSTEAHIPETPYILFLATVEPRKNVETLVAAYEQLQKTHPDVELVIAGGAGWKSDAVREKMRALEGVKYIDYVDEEQKWELLRGASVFVYPSLYEGFGFPPLEAQSVGTPVVVGNHTSLPEVLGNSAVYADVLDVNSLTRAIASVLEEPEYAKEMVQAGHENVKRFSWKKSAQQVLNVILSAHGK